MSETERRIRLHGAVSTSTGQIRENNEDNLFLWSQDEFMLAVVADGMGGAAAGEEASRLAVEAVESGMMTQTGLQASSDDMVTDIMCAAIRAANLNIVESAAANPEYRGMGTTMTLAFVRGTHVIVAHVGDSRAYHIQGTLRQIRQITSDHSFVEALVEAGHLTKEQAEEHPMRNVLYRALGQADEIDVDVYETRMHNGDRLVLCSDGLTRHVKETEIAQLITQYAEPAQAAQALIDRANALGGEDNISVVVIALEGAPDDEATVEIKKPILLDDTPTLHLSVEDTVRALPSLHPPESGTVQDEESSPDL